MPLPSSAAAREPIHTRRIECRGFRRVDGLWDIEGHLVDTKAYAFENRWRGTLEPGAPIHEMWLRLTIDDDLEVHAAVATTDASPFEICPAITPAFASLVGLRIGKGWSGRVRERLGGTKGCTHLVELALGAMATAAIQTVAPLRARKGDPDRKPGHLDTCHALASDGPVVREHYPRHYTGR